MAIGSTSDTTGLRAAREQARLRQSLLNREYRQAKRSGNYMGALKATMLGEELGVKVGGTVRSEDVAAAGQAQHDEEMKRVGKIDAPTGLDAYKAMQPQARMAQQQSATPEAAEDLTAQFRDIYGKAKTEDERLAIVRDAKKVGVPLSKFGEKLLSDAGEQAQAPEEVAPKIRPPMTRMGPGGKTEFTEEGKKYYESLETSPRVANMMAESEGARLGRKLGEQYRRAVGVLGTAAKNRRDASAIERDFAETVRPEYERKLRSMDPLQAEQARIKESVRQDVRSDIENEDTNKMLYAGLPRPATQFAKEKPDWVAPARPRLAAPQAVASVAPNYAEDRPRGSGPLVPMARRFQSSQDMDLAAYEKGKAEFEKRQKEQAQRQLELDRKIQEQRRLSLRPPTR